jgi:hypothetical protein
MSLEVPSPPKPVSKRLLEWLPQPLHKTSGVKRKSDEDSTETRDSSTEVGDSTSGSSASVDAELLDDEANCHTVKVQAPGDKRARKLRAFVARSLSDKIARALAGDYAQIDEMVRHFVDDDANFTFGSIDGVGREHVRRLYTAAVEGTVSLRRREKEIHGLCYTCNMMKWCDGEITVDGKTLLCGKSCTEQLHHVMQATDFLFGIHSRPEAYTKRGWEKRWEEIEDQLESYKTQPRF